MRLAAEHGTNRLAAPATSGSSPLGYRSETSFASLGGLMSALLGYLDPGSGSMILQVVAGGAAAAAVAGRLFWRRIATALRLKKKDDTPDA
jgi:hypothetical protein